jgi:putative addiction module component (TIGR02574 family)
MPMTKEQILAEAMALEPADRDDLADRLWRSVERANHQSVEEAWAAEADDRIAAHECGDLTARPMDEVVERLRNRPRR